MRRTCIGLKNHSYSWPRAHFDSIRANAGRQWALCRLGRAVCRLSSARATFSSGKGSFQATTGTENNTQSVLLSQPGVLLVGNLHTGAAR